MFRGSRKIGKPGKKRARGLWVIEFKVGGNINVMNMFGTVGYISGPGTAQQAFLRFPSGAEIKYNIAAELDYKSTSNNIAAFVNIEIASYSNGTLLDETAAHNNEPVCEDSPLLNVGTPFLSGIEENRINFSSEYAGFNGRTVCLRTGTAKIFLSSNADPDIINVDGMVSAYNLDSVSVYKLK